MNTVLLVLVLVMWSCGLFLCWRLHVRLLVCQVAVQALCDGLLAMCGELERKKLQEKLH